MCVLHAQITMILQDHCAWSCACHSKNQNEFHNYLASAHLPITLVRRRPAVATRERPGSIITWCWTKAVCTLSIILIQVLIQILIQVCTLTIIFIQVFIQVCTLSIILDQSCLHSFNYFDLSFDQKFVKILIKILIQVLIQVATCNSGSPGREAARSTGLLLKGV